MAIATLFLAQHGLAESKAVDPRKLLSSVGRSETRSVARALASRVRILRICHSGKLRARETAEIFARELGVVQFRNPKPLLMDLSALVAVLADTTFCCIFM